MTGQLANLHKLAPEVHLCIVGMIVMIADPFVSEARKRVLGWLAFAGALFGLFGVWRASQHLGFAYDNLISNDPFSIFVHAVVIVAAALAILGSIDIALRKAKTSVLFNNPSEALWEYCKPDGPGPATENTNGGLIPFAGGVPIRAADGSLIGAIGVSGGMPAQDGDVARVGLSGQR